MPHFWIRISLQTPKRLQPYVDDPPAFKRELNKIATECNAGLDEVFFDPSERVAWALIHVITGITDEERLRELLKDDKEEELVAVQLESAEERVLRLGGGGPPQQQQQSVPGKPRHTP